MLARGSGRVSGCNDFVRAVFLCTFELWYFLGKEFFLVFGVGMMHG
jgi:hypothetical protein